MTNTQLITIACIFQIIIVWQAAYQAHRFKINKPISHFGKGLLYGIICAAIGLCFLYGRWQEYYWYWQVPLLASFQRLAWFDIILNRMRGDVWYYVGRGTTGSLQSKIEGKLSDAWVRILKYVLMALWALTIGAIIWYHLKHEG